MPGFRDTGRMNRLRWPQKLAISTGALLVVWGVAGFFVTGFAGFAAESYPRMKALSGVGLLVAMLLLVTFGLGTARYDEQVVNVLNVNPGSNALHLLAGFAALAVAQGAVWCRQCDRAAALKNA